jgi:hypothetical protein
MKWNLLFLVFRILGSNLENLPIFSILRDLGICHLNEDDSIQALQIV